MHNSAVASTTLIWPAIVYGAIVIVLVTAILVMSHLLGERHSAPLRNDPYESGIRPTGSARLRFGATYYLVAVFFLIFDIEVALIIAWAMSFREVGWVGYIGAALFILTLAVGLVYIWKMRGLDWSPDYKSNTGGSKNDRS
jgi:NADH-quinone oxidoreductase subunit A